MIIIIATRTTHPFTTYQALIFYVDSCIDLSPEPDEWIILLYLLWDRKTEAQECQVIVHSLCSN